MYPNISKIKGKEVEPDFSCSWVQMIHSDMDRCVLNLANKKELNKLNSRKMMKKKSDVLWKSALDMLAYSLSLVKG